MSSTGYQSFVPNSLRALFAGLIVLSTCEVFGGDWNITPRATLSEEFTDNVTLVDQNTLSDFITSITPGLSVRGSSARLSMDIDYNFQNQLYLDNSNFDRTNHQLQSNAESTIINEVLFFNANATVSQRNANNRLRRARENRSRTGNVVDVITYEFQPILRHHFGSWADFEGSFIRGATINSGQNSSSIGSVGSGSDERLELMLRTGRRFAATNLTINYFDEKIEYDSGSDDEIRGLTATVSHHINRTLSLSATTGFDENNTSRASRNRNNGFRWSIGGTFTPTPRTKIRGDWGYRAFGETFNVSVDHRHRRLNFLLTYKEELSTAARRQRQEQLLQLNDLAGNPIFNLADAANFDVPLTSSSINEETSLSKYLNIALQYKMRRSLLSISYNDRDEEFQTSLVTEENKSLNITLSRDFTPRLNGSIWYRQSESIGRRRLGSSEDVNSAGGSATYQVGPHTSLNMSYSYTDSEDSGIGSENYLENAISASLTVFY